MSNVKAKVIAVVTRATGTISESLRQVLSNILGKYGIKELQKKTTTFSTAHVPRKVLM